MDDDELFYEEAVKVVRATGYAMASLIQRKLKVGYARAARLLDRMAAEGIVEDTPFIRKKILPYKR